MASHRAIETSTAATAADYGHERAAPARDAAYTTSGALLKRAALYARVSTEKQEREDTVASQVDLLYRAAAEHGYDIAPGSVFIDEGVSGTRLDRPAPDRLARRYAYQVLLVEELTRCGCEVVFGSWRATEQETGVSQLLPS
jgi:hypothetical protein